MRNAAAEGIDLQEIALQYEGLTADELKMLQTRQEVTHLLGDGKVFAKFPSDGSPPYLAHKVECAHYLGA